MPGRSPRRSGLRALGVSAWDPKAMDMAFNTMVGNLPESSATEQRTCALKIYSCVGSSPCGEARSQSGGGWKKRIVGMSSQESIDFLARLMKEGMGKTEETILSIMVGKEL